MNDRASPSTSSGLVWANRAYGTIWLDANLILDDDRHVGTNGTIYQPRWKASAHPQATLTFNRAAPSLEGYFILLDNADMVFNADVTTTGSLDHNVGSTITVLDGKTFMVALTGINTPQ